MKSAVRIAVLLFLLCGTAAGDINWSKLIPGFGPKPTEKPAGGGDFNLEDAVQDLKPTKPAEGGFDLEDAVGSDFEREVLQKLNSVMKTEEKIMQALCKSGTLKC